MNQQQASNVLRRHNKWRRDGIGRMQQPRVIGEAIEVARRVIAEHLVAMDVLRQIADGQRRTREQRLAKSCVTFLDSLPDELANARVDRARSESARPARHGRR